MEVKPRRFMNKTKGIIMAGGTGSRLFPITKAINKHLLPVYDKPMIYYPLSTLMLCGLREIALITNAEDKHHFQKLLGDGTDIGIQITYVNQPKASGIAEAYRLCADFLGASNSVLILGDNIFIGHGFGELLSENLVDNGALIFGCPVQDPENYGVIELDSKQNIISMEEKPIQPRSKLAIPGLYFFDNQAVDFATNLKYSSRNELEIIDLLNLYLNKNELRVRIVPRGTGWLDAGNVESLFAASDFVKTLQTRQGLNLNVPEEIAFNKGWISFNQLERLANGMSNTGHEKYLKSLLKRSQE